MKKIFIDGHSGTTGLEIQARLESREDLLLLLLGEGDRKNPQAKREMASQADLIILCLPDEAAKEAVSLYQGLKAKILDASSAHRVAPGWVYGMAELEKGQREKIAQAKKVANPGCYPTGFLLALAPLVRAGLVPKDYPVTIQAVSGYSGGGRQMIEEYEQPLGESYALRVYGLDLKHKHLPEMTAYSGLSSPPIFVPSVANFRQGMLVMVPLDPKRLNLGGAQPQARVLGVWQQAYQGEGYVRPVAGAELLDPKFLQATALNGTNKVELAAYGHQDQLLLVARLDNLGKGASGAAVQNLNLMLGFEETAGL